MATTDGEDTNCPADRLPGALPRLMPLLLGIIGVAGCANPAPKTQPSTMTERQDQALHDPFSYNPDFTKADRTVSGQNEPDGLKKDLHDVFNP